MNMIATYFGLNVINIDIYHMQSGHETKRGRFQCMIGMEIKLEGIVSYQLEIR